MASKDGVVIAARVVDSSRRGVLEMCSMAVAEITYRLGIRQAIEFTSRPFEDIQRERERVGRMISPVFACGLQVVSRDYVYAYWFPLCARSEEER